jgi:hypothetical protein
MDTGLAMGQLSWGGICPFHNNPSLLLMTSTMVVVEEEEEGVEEAVQ